MKGRQHHPRYATIHTPINQAVQSRHPPQQASFTTCKSTEDRQQGPAHATAAAPRRQEAAAAAGMGPSHLSQQAAHTHLCCRHGSPCAAPGACNHASAAARQPHQTPHQTRAQTHCRSPRPLTPHPARAAAASYCQGPGPPHKVHERGVLSWPGPWGTCPGNGRRHAGTRGCRPRLCAAAHAGRLRPAGQAQLLPHTHRGATPARGVLAPPGRQAGAQRQPPPPDQMIIQHRGPPSTIV